LIQLGGFDLQNRAPPHAPATKAGGIVAARTSLELGNVNPSVAALKRSIAGTDNSPCLGHYRKPIPALFIWDANSLPNC